jgi:hypothetical protein
MDGDAAGSLDLPINKQIASVFWRSGHRSSAAAIGEEAERAEAKDHHRTG